MRGSARRSNKVMIRIIKMMLIMMMISQLNLMCLCQNVKFENSAPLDGGSNDVGASLQTLGQECEDWPVQRVIHIIIIIINIIIEHSAKSARTGLCRG